MGALLVSGCGYGHDEHITGPYRLIAVDVDKQMSISYDLGDGSAIGRIDETVFAFGYDKRFIVAKQHPDGDRSVTNYFYLDMTKDSKYADPSDSVIGPLTKTEFAAEAKRLNLPEFTRTLTALERRRLTSQWWQRRTTPLVRFALDAFFPPCHTSNGSQKYLCQNLGVLVAMSMISRQFLMRDGLRFEMETTRL